ASTACRQPDRSHHQMGSPGLLAGGRRSLRRVRLQAHRRPEQRGVVVAPGVGGVHQGLREAHALPGPERDRHRGGLRGRRRALRGRRRRGHRPRRRVREPRGRRGRGPRSPGVRGRPGDADAGYVQLRRQRVDGDARRRRGAAGHRGDRRCGDLHQRRRRPGRRRVRGVRGPRQHPAVRDPWHRDPDPAVHLPQPDPLAAADHLRRRRSHCLARAHLLPGEVRRPHRERAEPGDPHDPRHRRRHRLCLAARRALSGGAPSPRGPARGDGVRAAPRRAGDPGQRRNGDRRAPVPAPRRDELDRRSRAGHRDRCRRDLPGHDHAAARAPRRRRPLGLLAQAPRLRLGRADVHRCLGEHRPPDRRTPPTGVGHHHRRAGDRVPRALPPRHRRPGNRGQLHQGVPVDHRPAGARRARPRRRVEHGHGGGQCRQRGRRARGDDRHRGRRGAEQARGPGRRRVRPGHRGRRRRLDGGVRPGRGCARPRARRGGRRRPRGRVVGDLPRHQGGLDAGQPRHHPDRAAGRPADPGAAPARLGRAGDPARHRGAVIRCGAGHLGAALRVRLRLRRLRPGVPVVRVRVPGGPGHRLQHLPDDSGTGGVDRTRDPEGCARGTHDDGWGHHLRRHRPGRDVPGARHDPAGVPRRARHRRGAGHPARHAHRPVGPGDGAQPRPGSGHLVAGQAGERQHRRPAAGGCLARRAGAGRRL
ncbi:MAG: transporter, MMPL family, partial [uncultured Nocardioidaceae bacterium]